MKNGFSVFLMNLIRDFFEASLHKAAHQLLCAETFLCLLGALGPTEVFDSSPSDRDVPAEH